MRKTGIALVGYGGMGVWHNNLLERIEELELVGVYDIKEDRCELARARGVHTYASLDDLLADERVEIVSVIIPNHLHKDVCIQAMRAGKNVKTIIQTSETKDTFTFKFGVIDVSINLNSACLLR